MVDKSTMATNPNTLPGGHVNEPCDDFACEACGGMGFVKVGLAKNGHDNTPPIFPDCRHCEGTGVMTEAKCEAYRNR